jgi:uncharacterized protein (TIGR03546 family)
MEGLAQLRFKEKIRKVFQSHGSPSDIALGIAIGVFIGILPLYGFHLLLWVLFSFLVRRANKVAIFVGTNISLPPTVPIITWAGYEIGRLVLAAKNYPPLDSDYFRHITFKNIGSFYLPLFVGSVILGVTCGIIFYGITYAILRFRQKRKNGGKHGA